jgi:hypothetical protein
MPLTCNFADDEDRADVLLSNRSRARCVPDRPDVEGIWRILTDRAKCRWPAAILLTALPALIPKLIVLAVPPVDA